MSVAVGSQRRHIARKGGFFRNHARYKDYILQYSKILFRQRISETKLGVLWLFLDPLGFMLVYGFVMSVLFSGKMPHFEIYVFIGLTAWKLFSGAVLSGPTSIVRNRQIFEKVYFHKFVYPTVYLMVCLYEYLIASSLILVIMLVSGVPYTWHMLEAIPVMAVLAALTNGFSLIAAHIGVYLMDLRNVLEIVLRLLFYTTPIMWSFTMISAENAQKIGFLAFNPIAVIITNLRDALIYGKSPDYPELTVMLLVSCLLITFGYCLISRHEDEYGRVT